MTSDHDARRMHDAIADALGHDDAHRVLTGFVVVSTWADADGEPIIDTLCSDELPVWHALGLLAHATELQRLHVDPDRDCGHGPRHG